MLNRFLKSMAKSWLQPQKKTKLSKDEKNALKKALQVTRKQERKRNVEDFSHYENCYISDYYFEGGFRKVYPYNFTFKAYAKRRWVNRSVYDVLLEEFNFPNPSVILQRCSLGDIQVNGNCVAPHYLLKDSDLLSHKTHRHERPILDTPIHFIYEDNEVLVLSKPASIPVHPCGQYTLNSMLHILAREYGHRPLRFIHRLDRMTSGLLITGKTYDSSLRLASQIGAREVKKYYICQVEGLFPDHNPGACVDQLPPDVVTCAMPLGPFCPKMGLHAVLAEEAGGKAARTHFMRLSHNPVTHTSLVLCRLFTGRTHQIRVHLQYLGFPIVDDPLYNTSDWGEHKGKGGDYGVPLDEVAKRISTSRDVSWYLEDKQDTSTPALDRFQAQLDASSLDQVTRDRLLKCFDPECLDCQRRFRDPDQKNCILRLHAYRYSGTNWSYTAPLPDWALTEATSATELTAFIEACMSRI